MTSSESASGFGSKKPNPYRRTQARRRALQALYQWDLTGQSASDIDAQFRVNQEMDRVDVEYFSDLLRGVVGNAAKLDAAIAPHSDIALADCDPIERNVLRLAAFELMYRLDIPVRVAVNESVELTKLFGAEGGYKYVNGVVDKLAHVARKVEMG
ncbi:MAG: transcription antitermination factor NusB [Gammaproteobacteria bacterium]|nr:transcription antitermination factor NusB [Gammaproteobacteria bacterium]MCP5137882.1 transcription antitermination factor NusB [Gammaproteobacteria bacterium]